jgi:hypothetical protein
MRSKKIIVLGFMGGCPIAGVIWQHIHYIVGLQRLGHDVHYVEDRSNYPYNPVTLDISTNFSYAANTLGKLASLFGFENRWAYCARYKQPFAMAGMEWDALLRLYRDADCALNICGSHLIHEDLASIRHLIYVETDPGVEQIKVDQGERDTIDHLRWHQHLFTFGENVGTPAFSVPLHGFTWLATRQPVITDFWCATNDRPAPVPEALFTSICNWSTAGKKDIVWRGSNYLWSKSDSFIRFIEAPKRSAQPFEIAADIADKSELELFLRHKWKVVPPYDLSVDWDAYREYIRNSKGEFTCAKDQYVRLNTGWFSDRTACYLAAGRPAITQETGFTMHYGGTEGLLAFSIMEEIIDAVARINRDYARHSRAALAIAREIFEAEKVLKSLLERAGI